MKTRKRDKEPLFLDEKPKICEDREPGGRDTISQMRTVQSRADVLANALREMGVECDYLGATDESEVE